MICYNSPILIWPICDLCPKLKNVTNIALNCQEKSNINSTNDIKRLHGRSLIQIVYQKKCKCMEYNSPEKWLHGLVTPAIGPNKSKKLTQLPGTAYSSGTQHTRQSLNEKQHIHGFTDKLSSMLFVYDKYDVYEKYDVYDKKKDLG